VVAACAAAHTPITPQAQYRLVGARPRGRDVLSLSRLRQVREVDALADVMIVEAGVTLAEAQAAAERADRLFPLSSRARLLHHWRQPFDNAGGVAVLAYGNARELTTASRSCWRMGESSMRCRSCARTIRIRPQELFVGSEARSASLPPLR